MNAPYHSPQEGRPLKTIALNESFNLSFELPVPLRQLLPEYEGICQDLIYGLQKMGYEVELTRVDAAVTQFEVHRVTLENAFVIKDMLARYIKTGYDQYFGHPIQGN